MTGLFSSAVRQYRELLLSPWSGHGHHTFKVLQQRFFSCDGQGAVRQAILYADRSCSIEMEVRGSYANNYRIIILVSHETDIV